MTDNKFRDQFKELYKAGNITFFLGAGISVSNGLPTWKELVTSMYFKFMSAESWGRLRPFPNYLYIISKHYMRKMNESPDIIVRKLKTGWSEREFGQTLWDSLYGARIKNKTVGHYDINYLPAYIANVIKKDKTKIKSVITYNFDDILEETFRKKGFRSYSTIYDSKTKIETNKVPIYHIHGYVPFNNNPDKRLFGKVVISEEDYNNLFNDSKHWANIVQLRSLTSTTNIMIGLSLNDPNLRRILDITSKQPVNTKTFIFLKKPEQIKFEDAEIEIIDKEARELMREWSEGGGVKTSNKKHKQIKSIINGVSQNDIENNTRVLKSMKITPVWVDDYREITYYLNELIK
jgi:SIR2-like domain